MGNNDFHASLIFTCQAMRAITETAGQGAQSDLYFLAFTHTNLTILMIALVAIHIIASDQRISGNHPVRGPQPLYAACLVSAFVSLIPPAFPRRKQGIRVADEPVLLPFKDTGSQVIAALVIVFGVLAVDLWHPLGCLCTYF